MAYMMAPAAEAQGSHLHSEEGAAALELTVLVPCLNEARTVADCVAAALGFLQTASVAGEVLVADNGSTDGSQALARQAGARVIDVPRRGYGAALGAGIAAARGRFVVMGDADGSYDFTSLLAFIDRLRGGAQLVMGNRFQGGIAPGAMPWLAPLPGQPGAEFHRALVLSRADRRFSLRAARLFSRGHAGPGLVSPGMEFASEMVAKAALAGLPIEEVPTTLRPDGRDRPPHLRTWRDGWRHLRFLLLFCPRWLFLYPGLLLMLLGLAGFALGAVGACSVCILCCTWPPPPCWVGS
jgi:glycosyltransferase involved in cell wall biosynthesis